MGSFVMLPGGAVVQEPAAAKLTDPGRGDNWWRKRLRSLFNEMHFLSVVHLRRRHVRRFLRKLSQHIGALIALVTSPRPRAPYIWYLSNPLQVAEPTYDHDDSAARQLAEDVCNQQTATAEEHVEALDGGLAVEGYLWARPCHTHYSLLIQFVINSLLCYLWPLLIPTTHFCSWAIHYGHCLSPFWDGEINTERRASLLSQCFSCFLATDTASSSTAAKELSSSPAPSVGSE